ncbi:alpha/beta fold hydrolase [Geodermatophilus sp. DSM 45219]|uniref:alpha/beta fold hydrolase n=1 Tax=Geodermatophilus sp. DSM 45219 TaxID=1881103 RepID=UPI00088B7567|nr:alpha/beta hydrolase [Geodermatophilus sp. DSM 45219]SDN76161.1 Pimeloyl-ACP methyl ester carboxylesterase [Geodermatophilus sp. DSM 45219]
MTALRVAAVVAAALALRLWGSRRVARRRADGPTGLRTDDGVRLHVEVGGSRDASPTVVLVHGFAARSSMWDAQWDRLCADARVVRYDQRGHGRSGWAGRLRAGPDRLGRDLGQVVDRYGGPGPVVLVGHSMGGMAVLALAGQRPELVRDRVAGVALVSTLAAPLALAGSTADPTGPDDAVRRVRTWLARAAAWGLWLATPLVHALHPFRTRPVQRLLRGRLFAADPPEAAVREMTDAWTTTPTAVTAASLPGLAGYDRRAAVEALRGVPVLVLTGADDATIPASAVARLARRIGPRARLVTVPGAGHMVPLTHAGVVTPALLDLVARCRAADGRRTS